MSYLKNHSTDLMKAAPPDTLRRERVLERLNKIQSKHRASRGFDGEALACMTKDSRTQTSVAVAEATTRRDLALMELTEHTESIHRKLQRQEQRLASLKGRDKAPSSPLTGESIPPPSPSNDLLKRSDDPLKPSDDPLKPSDDLLKKPSDDPPLPLLLPQDQAASAARPNDTLALLTSAQIKREFYSTKDDQQKKNVEDRLSSLSKRLQHVTAARPTTTPSNRVDSPSPPSTVVLSPSSNPSVLDEAPKKVDTSAHTDIPPILNDPSPQLVNEIELTSLVPELSLEPSPPSPVDTSVHLDSPHASPVASISEPSIPQSLSSESSNSKLESSMSNPESKSEAPISESSIPEKSKETKKSSTLSNIDWDALSQDDDNDETDTDDDDDDTQTDDDDNHINKNDNKIDDNDDDDNNINDINDNNHGKSIVVISKPAPVKTVIDWDNLSDPETTSDDDEIADLQPKKPPSSLAGIKWDDFSQSDDDEPSDSDGNGDGDGDGDVVDQPPKKIDAAEKNANTVPKPAAKSIKGFDWDALSSGSESPSGSQDDSSGGDEEEEGSEDAPARIDDMRARMWAALMAEEEEAAAEKLEADTLKQAKVALKPLPSPDPKSAAGPKHDAKETGAKGGKDTKSFFLGLGKQKKHEPAPAPVKKHEPAPAPVKKHDPSTVIELTAPSEQKRSTSPRKSMYNKFKFFGHSKKQLRPVSIIHQPGSTSNQRPKRNSLTLKPESLTPAFLPQPTGVSSLHIDPFFSMLLTPQVTEPPEPLPQSPSADPTASAANPVPNNAIEKDPSNDSSPVVSTSAAVSTPATMDPADKIQQTLRKLTDSIQHQESRLISLSNSGGRSSSPPQHAPAQEILTSPPNAPAVSEGVDASLAAQFDPDDIVLGCHRIHPQPHQEAADAARTAPQAPASSDHPEEVRSRSEVHSSSFEETTSSSSSSYIIQPISATTNPVPLESSKPDTAAPSNSSIPSSSTSSSHLDSPASSPSHSTASPKRHSTGAPRKASIYNLLPNSKKRKNKQQQNHPPPEPVSYKISNVLHVVHTGAGELVRKMNQDGLLDDSEIPSHLQSSPESST